PTCTFLLDTNMRYVIGSGVPSPLLAPAPTGRAGKTLPQVLSPALDPAWIDDLHRHCREVMRQGEQRFYDDAVEQTDGQPFFLQIVLSPLVGENGGVKGLVVSLADVTELVAARQAAETAATIKSTFLANMSHEIRTPLSAITGIAELLLPPPGLADAPRKFVSDIKLAAAHLVTIVNDVLDMSKLDADKMTLSPVDFDFGEFLGGLEDLALYLAKDKDIVFSVETADDIPPVLFADDVRLRQVLVNLIGNAIKFTEAGRVTLRVMCADNRLRFEIHDTGPGIPPGERDRLFRPFGQLERAVNRNLRGTGLGLSIASSMVRLMGGTIELVDSVPGKGSVFAVTVPMEQGELKENTTNTDGLRVGFSNAARILIVDDNEVNLAVAAGLLKSIYGLDSDKALSGRDALDLAEQVPYDLIFMDHMMPDMDGVECTANLRKMGEWGKNVAIVALTANAVTGAREMLLGAGMNDFLAKPVNRRELERVLLRWLPEKYQIHSGPDEDGGQGVTRRHTDRAVAPAAMIQAVMNQARREPDNSPILYRLETIPGLDVRNGLGSVFGQEEIYLKTLRILRGKIPDIAAQMENLLHAGALKELAIAAHGMKSSLAGVGCAQLSKTARELETAAENGDSDFCRQEVPHFARQLRELGRNLDSIFTPMFDPDGSRAAQRDREDKASTAVLRKHLVDMRRALASGDSGLFSGSLEPLLGLEFGNEVDMLLKLLKQKADDLDYDGARAFLDFHFPDA
ncbi:MAG: response regulator, partial [Planctomycetes bacterium]|nr:response regulator [Planctomycetota bacterium]